MPTIDAAVDDDKEHTTLKDTIRRWTAINNLPPHHPAKHLKNIWQKLSISSDEKYIIFDGNCILPPRNTRREVIKFFHKGHCNATRTKNLIKESFFWPKLKNETVQHVSNCETCRRLQPAQQQEPLTASTNNYPMERVGVDLFHLNGKNFLAMADGYSGFPFAAKLQSLRTGTIVKTLTNWFRDFGFPKYILSLIHI